MELQYYLGAVRRYWWIVVVTTLVGLLVALAVVTFSPQKYQSSVTFFVNSTQDPKNLLQGDLYAQSRVDSYVLLASSDHLVDSIITDTGVQMTTQQLSNQITASAQANTVLLNVDITDSSAEQSLVLATSMSTQMPKLVHALDPSVTMTIVSGPALTPGAVSPRKAVDVGLGLLLGLGLGVALAVRKERRGDKVRSTADLRWKSAAPVLADIRPGDAASVRAASTDAQTHSALTRTTAELLHQGASTVVVADCSEPGDAALVSAQLATTAAASGHSVVLVEADLRHAPLDGVLQLEPGLGLSDLLADEVAIKATLQSTAEGRVAVIGPGTHLSDPETLLSRRSTVQVLAELRRQFDVVVVHAPPVLPNADTGILAQETDGVIVTVRRGASTKKGARQAVDVLKGLEVRTLGTILTTRGKGSRADRSAGDHPHVHGTAEPTSAKGAKVRSS